MRLPPSSLAGLAAWVVTALVAAGGAQANLGGWALGLPGPLALGAVLAGGAFLARAPEGARLALGLLPLLVLVLSGLPLPGLAAWTGWPLLVPAVAVVVMAALPSLVRARSLFLPVVGLLYFAIAARVQTTVGAQGDEPHYLMVAESLLRDGDLELERDFAEGRYWSFHDGRLEPHYRVRGREGRIYSLHAVGLSLLLLPAYALGGYPAASLLMALLAALLAREIRALAAEWSGDEGVGALVGWVAALSPPLVHYAGLVFTEVPAALALAFALRTASSEPRRRQLGLALAAGAAVAFLPWLNVRNAALTIVVLIWVLAMRPGLQAATAWLAPSFASALSLMGYHWTLYGFLDPRRIYGRRPEFSLGTLREGLPGLLLDQEFGILVYAPILVLFVPGLLGLARTSRSRAAVAAALVGATVLTAGTWHMWRGGWNPPARFLVTVVAPLFAGAAVAIARGGLGVGRAVLVAWGLCAGLAGASHPWLVHRDRDVTAPLFRTFAGAEEWTRLFPGYVLEEAARDRLPLTLIWVLGLAAAARGSRTAAPAGLALCSAGMLAAAGLATHLSSARPVGREAVHLVGRTALAVPGWTPWARSPSAWHLPGEGVHDPRRPLVLGERLELRPGSYLLSLQCDDLGATQAGPPRLAVIPEPRFIPRLLALGQAAQAGELVVEGRFQIASGERAATLELREGGPLRVRAVRLSRVD